MRLLKNAGKDGKSSAFRFRPVNRFARRLTGFALSKRQDNGKNQARESVKTGGFSNRTAKNSFP